MKTRRILGVLVAAMLTTASICSAVEGTWTRKRDMPTARICPYSAVADGKIYAIGGGPDITGGYLSTVEMYDPTTNTWTRKANMPTARNGHAVSAVNGKIYAIGGEPSAQASISTVEEYDPATDTWTQKADMPTKRTFLCAATAHGKIYVLGGGTAGGPEGNTYLTALEVYDPATDTWTRKADMLAPRSNAVACAVDGKIYLMGGTFGALHQSPTSAVEAYDPVTDTWTKKTNMPTARTGLCASVVGGKIYAIGGGVWNGPIFSTVEVYDPTTDTWTTEPDMPTPRILFSTSPVDGKIYAIGGSSQWYPCPGISTVEEYNLAPPPPDFNGDGSVDGKDVLILAEYWGTDDPTCDIAPWPSGDGLVDLQDVVALAEYIGEEVNDPTLIAHWALDETEGIAVLDSAGDHHGYVGGTPTWEPGAGKIGGALAFDGTYFVVADAVLSPADGPFSVLAWIKGAGPGQVIVSQAGGADWLLADSAAGALMTDLKDETTRFPKALKSEIVVTDDDWHRVGLVWDGANRMLYVDGVTVAADTQSDLPDCGGGLYLGCGHGAAAETFFTGLIDDVRIYSRTVRP